MAWHEVVSQAQMGLRALHEQPEVDSPRRAQRTRSGKAMHAADAFNQQGVKLATRTRAMSTTPKRAREDDPAPRRGA